MTRLLLFICFTILYFCAKSQHVQTEIKTFRDENLNPYAEIFIHLDRDILDYQELLGGSIYAEIDVVLSVHQEQAVLFSDSFSIQSPLLNYPRDLNYNRQYNLPNKGIFDFHVDFIQDSSVVYSHDKRIDVINYDSKIVMSDVLLIGTFIETNKTSGPMIKGGYKLELLHEINDRKQNNIYAYCEVYDQRSSYQNRHFIQLSLLDGDKNFMKSQVYNLDASASGAYMYPIETSDLTSGNYFLVSELKRYPDGLSICSDTSFFYRDNPFLGEDMDSLKAHVNQEFVAELDDGELDYCLRAVVPVVPQKFSDEWAEVARRGTAEEKRLLLLKYYTFMDHNMYFNEFLQYMEKVELCNREFESGFGYGFESDRGVIYLKYGPPSDQFHREHESTAPPYEIWSYNKIEQTKQTNVKFIFHNPSLAPGNYILLHSTARGEVYNPRWKLDLYKNSPWDQRSNSIDETNVLRQFTRRAGKNFEDF